MLCTCAIIILTGFLQDLPMDSAESTGRQILKCTKALRLCSVFAAQVVKNGFTADGKLSGGTAKNPKRSHDFSLRGGAAK